MKSGVERSNLTNMRGRKGFFNKLLREDDFKDVRLTGRSGDGGIDGEWILEIYPLFGFQLVISSQSLSRLGGRKYEQGFPRSPDWKS
jgi:hypothetical protein